MTKKTILITGGSRGIGAATALHAARVGFTVCFTYLNNKDSAKEVLSRIEAEGGEGHMIRADVSKEPDVLSLFGFIRERFGTLDALVNNAGVLQTQMRFADMSFDRFRNIFDINVFGTFLCTREAVRIMSTKNGGRGGAVVNVSSVAAKTGSPGEYIDYAASKGAIDTFTLGLAREVAIEGIRVNAVRPGFIQTDIHASGGDPGRVERIKGSIPMRRGGKPEEVAAAIAWLLSEEASYVTGSIIDLAGGR